MKIDILGWYLEVFYRRLAKDELGKSWHHLNWGS